MWAHYANNHSGFVVEFDLEVLKEEFKESPILDVIYREKPNADLKERLKAAEALKKPRYAHFLQRAVFREAYFSKFEQWSYEQECRYVDLKKQTVNVSGNDILYVPMDAVTSIIVGSSAPEDLVEQSKQIAGEYCIDWFKLKIGRSQPYPYFINEVGDSYLFQDSELSPARNVCNSCSEPVKSTYSQCAWCSITDAHREVAEQNNPYRVLESVGILEEYLRSVSKL